MTATANSGASTSFVPELPGLLYGLGLVAASNALVLAWHAAWRSSGLAKPTNMRRHGKTIPDFDWSVNLKKHLSSWEGYILLTTYLSSVWFFELLPNSYYDFESKTNWLDVLLQLIVVDFYGFIVHHIEHFFVNGFYKKSHKPHHNYINPKLLDAFSGSLVDTLCLILIPLYLTSLTIYWTNTASWAAFGASYSSWFLIIHSEVRQPWDPIFQFLGLGTPADHAVHHALVKYNFAHFFAWFDIIFGTYKHPRLVLDEGAYGAKSK